MITEIRDYEVVISSHQLNASVGHLNLLEQRYPCSQHRKYQYTPFTEVSGVLCCLVGLISV